MPELAIDTASDDAAIAVVEAGRVLAEHRWQITTTTSRELLSAIEATLAAAGVSRLALTGIAVCTGPGGYGSLRAGVATAQGLALGLGVPLAGVSRLELQAFPHLRPDTTVIAVHDAGRMGVAWAAYRACELIEDARSAPPECVAAPRITDLDVCAGLAPSGIWCGEVSAELRRALHAASGETRDAGGRSGDTEVRAATNVRAAADLVRLAHLHRAFGDPAAVDVAYLRPPSIGARAGGP